jgi:hemerythrin-like domain-containing protein
MQAANEGAAGRRHFVTRVAAGGAAALLGCGGREESPQTHGAVITPAEDLMGEHGIIRRVMVVWGELDGPLRRGESIDAAALASSVDVVQWFIERYHERQEEDEVFPRLEHAGREVALVRTLRAQHEVGRANTQALAALISSGLDESTRPRIADRLADHCRMYAAHASREDTVVFPALRELLGEGWLELGERFEQNEDHTVGEGGLERALDQVRNVERAFGLSDLATFTPPRRV